MYNWSAMLLTLKFIYIFFFLYKQAMAFGFETVCMYNQWNEWQQQQQHHSTIEPKRTLVAFAATVDTVRMTAQRWQTKMPKQLKQCGKRAKIIVRSRTKKKKRNNNNKNWWILHWFLLRCAQVNEERRWENWNNNLNALCAVSSINVHSVVPYVFFSFRMYRICVFGWIRMIYIYTIYI